MTAASIHETLAIGAITGMRSMAGPAVLAHGRGRSFALAMKTLAVGEMIADKTPFVGNRIEPLPLAGRALIGLIVGCTIAREHRGNMIAGGLLGATAAVTAAYLAYEGRRRLTIPDALVGAGEDALVLAIGRWYAQRHV